MKGEKSLPHPLSIHHSLITINMKDVFYSRVLKPVLDNILSFSTRNALCIDEHYYSYSTFGKAISGILHEMLETNFQSQKVGLVINDDIETYASIFALWLQGKSYVPLHPDWPLARCLDICEQVELDLILDSSTESRYGGIRVIKTRGRSGMQPLFAVDCVEDELAYILFTSGSTGRPKGVQLSRGNLASFVDAFFDRYSLDEQDKCLQCFDLSFDLSIVSYLVPLMRGACVYTVPLDEIKYTYIGSLIEDEHLTFALMAPSTIRYLKPHFDEMDGSSLKYSLFCGEALSEDVTGEWSECARNAIIDNVYGPTENTIFCSAYRFKRDCKNKSHNGILSIGKPVKGCKMAIFDEQHNECLGGEIGELCLSGPQLTLGYYKNKEKNEESFFVKEGIRWYRSGDLAYNDADGDVMYVGRLDHQTKIQGYRVELGEVEWHAREFLRDKNVVCMAVDNKDGVTEIAMFVECEEFNPDEMNDYLRSRMPAYMIPTRLFFVPEFPLNSNGKTDRVKMKAMIR